MLNAQTTITFKPDSSLGKDAIVFTRVGANDANTNFGAYPELVMITWTWDGNLGTNRSLIKFEELSTIPSNAVITDVKLKFYGISSSASAPQGNSYYTGSTFPTNPVLVKRITSACNENTVTWNNQPSTITANQMTITPSVSKWNWNYIINNTPELKAIVQDMVNYPSTNHRFMLQLETEQTYRDMLFASSDHPDSTLWPE
ncbi:MAG: repeat protein [Bacteroidetes bacterium]|nr:repeat protein [Bacteroidota bacterium]